MIVTSHDKARFWKGKKVLLTGHTGFKGSWLSIWLSNLGAELIGYSLPPPIDTSLFEIAKIKKEIVSIVGNVLDLEHLRKTINKYKPEIVVHMAAQSLVSLSYLKPLETFSTNVLGTVNLFEAIRQADCVKVVVNVTSDKCYENKEQEKAYKEEDSLGGYDPYSSSKGCAELVTNAYRLSFFNPDIFLEHGTVIASVRSGNVIGGGDWSTDRLVPDIVRAISNSKTLTVRNPQAIRPWQHVLEPLSAYLLLIEKMWNEGPKFGEAWNFGPSDSDVKSVEWIVKRFIELWGKDIKWEIDKNPKFHEARSLKLDCTKAREKLGWYRCWDVDKALEKTIVWYKALKDKSEMNSFTRSQIKEYEEEQIVNYRNLLNV